MAKKILWMSDSPTINSGFAKVTREILNRLVAHSEYEVACVGWFYDGDPVARRSYLYDLYPSDGISYGRDTLERVINHIHPDILITLGDIWMVEWIPAILARKQLTWIGYFPIDGEPLPQSWLSIIRNMDIPITMSKYGQSVLAYVIPYLKTEMIYLGVDTRAFFPLESLDQIKRDIGLENKFVIGCIARNQPRKQIPILMKAFAKFSKRYDNSFLYLHMDPNDRGWDLFELMDQYNIRSKCFLTPNVSVGRGVSEETLNEIYNLFNVMALPTSGEGFGLPIVESMAAGVPVIATNYSSCPELINGRGRLIQIKETYTDCRPFAPIERALADVDDLVRQIDVLYNDSTLLAEYKIKAREFALQFDWDIIFEQWLSLLKKL